MPEQLTKPLKPLRNSGNPAGDFQHNMQQCGVCYIRYQGLVEAVENRQRE